MHKTETHNQRSGDALLWHLLASSNQSQTYPESDGYEPSGSSDFTGSGVRSEGMVSDVGLCNEMPTVSAHGEWRKRYVLVVRLLELFFFPKEKGAVR